MIKWPKDLKRARKLQEILQKKVKITPLKKKPEYIAGVDASFLNNKVIGVACLYKYPEMHSPRRSICSCRDFVSLYTRLFIFQRGSGHHKGN